MPVLIEEKRCRQSTGWTWHSLFKLFRMHLVTVLRILSPSSRSLRARPPRPKAATSSLVMASISACTLGSTADIVVAFGFFQVVLQLLQTALVCGCGLHVQPQTGLACPGNV